MQRRLREQFRVGSAVLATAFAFAVGVRNAAQKISEDGPRTEVKNQSGSLHRSTQLLDDKAYVGRGGYPGRVKRVLDSEKIGWIKAAARKYFEKTQGS